MVRLGFVVEVEVEVVAGWRWLVVVGERKRSARLEGLSRQQIGP